MVHRALPPSVQRFVEESIPSVLHLEALLFLRSRPDQEISAQSLARALYVSDASVARALDDLVRRQLVRESSSNGLFAYVPATPRLREQVDELAETYRERLVPLHEFIHERAAANSLQDFADAFRIRKD